MFRHPLLVTPDIEDEYGEERWVGIEPITGCVAFVAFTERVEGTIRIISLRKATNTERREYEEALQNGLEAN